MNGRLLARLGALVAGALALLSCNDVLDIESHGLAPVSPCGSSSVLCVVGGIGSMEGFLADVGGDGGLTVTAVTESDGGGDPASAPAPTSIMLTDVGFEWGPMLCVGSTCVSGGIEP